MLATAAALSACSGGSLTGEVTDGGTPDPGGGTDPIVTPALGNTNGGTFTAGAIRIADTSLDAGQNTALTVNFVDTNASNAPITDGFTVEFSSTCVSNSEASFSAESVTSSTGTATTTYTPGTCSGTDTITATVVFDGDTFTASGVVTVVPLTATSIQFESATPTSIGLQGSGQPDTSIVVFEVTNASGLPVQGQPVTFTLNTSVGGITLSPNTGGAGTVGTGTTDVNGRVQTTVRSGTVQTSVRVTATLDDDPDTTGTDESLVPPATSSSLVIATGLPDQDSFSLSVGCFNIEGHNYDGTETSVFVNTADRFNNPVPDGTPIFFRTEAHSITASCLTTNGSCTATVRSQGVRTSDHRITILGATIGEESFVDVNSDGRYDDGEPFGDLTDVFLDKDEDSAFDPGELIDFDSDGTFDAASGNFTGPLCDGPVSCDDDTSLYVRDSEIIIMSGSDAFFEFSTPTIDLSDGAVAVTVLIGDSADQPMPGGTSIVAATTFGSIVGSATFTQACTTLDGKFPYTWIVTPPGGATDGSGVFTVTVTTPKGTVTTAAIPVSFSGTPPPPPPPDGDLGSIAFVAATPTTIGIAGSGLEETSTVQFQVLSTTGVPIEGQEVFFTLNTSVGGITADPTSDFTDSNGFVRTIVHSGTIHTSVKVTATATDPDLAITVSAISDALTITTGIPDQDSFTLSAATINSESFDCNGEEVGITVHAADRFNNPVADGTAIALETEGGAVFGDCLTSSGECSVVWRSQNPRPADGRITLLASAIGEESFLDVNGDGRYGPSAEPNLTDMPEAFRDDDEDGTFDDGFEEFLDFNSNNAYDPASGNFTGVLCDTGCDTATTLHVRQSIVMVMSGSTAVVATSDVSGTGWDNVNTFALMDKQFATFSFVVRDARDQPMPAGTTVSLSTDGDAGTIVGNASLETPNTNDDSGAANTYTFAFRAADLDALETGFSVLELSVQTPGNECDDDGTKVVFTFFVTTTGA